MSAPAISAYAALANEYPRLTDTLRGATATEVAALAEGLERRARDLLAPLDRETLGNVAAWHIDHFYCLLHALSFLDRASLTFARAVGAALRAALTNAGVSVASLVDNEIPHDRMVPLKALFNSLGFVVASPELLAQDLAKHDGLAVDDVNGPHLPSYLAEATGLAVRLFEETLAKRLPVLWASGSTELETYVRLARLLAEVPYIGIFRNQPPDLEQAVQLFQTLTHRIAIDPNY